MKNSAFLAAVIIAAGGASYGVEAWAADVVPTGASAATAASAPKPCTDGWELYCHGLPADLAGHHGLRHD